MPLEGLGLEVPSIASVKEIVERFERNVRLCGYSCVSHIVPSASDARARWRRLCQQENTRPDLGAAIPYCHAGIGSTANRGSVAVLRLPHAQTGQGYVAGILDEEPVAPTRRQRAG